MTTEEVFAEMEEIVRKTECSFRVYKHTDPAGKVYTGYCLGDWKKCWKNGSGYHTNKRFHEAIREIGAGNFTHEVLASVLKYAEALDLERQVILEYDSTDLERGYNVIVEEKHPDSRKAISR